MGQTNNNNIISVEYHAAISVEFDRDGMGQTNNNNIVSGEYHWAISVEFNVDRLGQTNNNNIVPEHSHHFPGDMICRTLRNLLGQLL